jgi:hypothetical protein
MIIGLISDTHDNIYAIKSAVEKFNQERVKLVLHAGDYIAPFTAEHFKTLEAPMIGVFGNNCAETALLKEVYSRIGVEIRGYFTEIDADGVIIALFHGHRGQDNNKAESGGYDVVVRGHTHRAKIEKIDDTLNVNPGEACGYLTGERTVAFLDTERKIAWPGNLD